MLGRNPLFSSRGSNMGKIEVHPEHILGVSRHLQTFSSLTRPPPTRQPPLTRPFLTTPSGPQCCPPLSPQAFRTLAPPESLGLVDGVLGWWGVRAGAWESPGWPLGRQPQPGVVATPSPLGRGSPPRPFQEEVRKRDEKKRRKNEKRKEGGKGREGKSAVKAS